MSPRVSELTMESSYLCVFESWTVATTHFATDLAAMMKVLANTRIYEGESRCMLGFLAIAIPQSIMRPSIEICIIAPRLDVTKPSANLDYPEGFCISVAVDVQLNMKDTNLQSVFVTSRDVKLLSVRSLDGYGFEFSESRQPAFDEFQIRKHMCLHSEAVTAAIWVLLQA
ncbi:uncharacterized protein RSE6_13328 [Rhynchosporium secalis]|uniref:Uncharacterized protein n=1 Tax=Rhynchosporium secalis TaxID=38038 RepID=A0A1E1MSL9_RHYSE|nr:uncharacterized protein RSE6_13328 [Rhynchosporium secalis]